MANLISPSGCIFAVEALDIEDEDLMADRTSNDRNKLPKLLKKYVKLVDGAGIYKGPDFSKFLFGDRFWMTLMLRCRSYGNDVDAMVTCKNRICEKPFTSSLDLWRALLPFVPESIDHLLETQQNGILLDNLESEFSRWYPHGWSMDPEHTDLLCVPEFECDPEDPSTWIDISPDPDEGRPLYIKRMGVEMRTKVVGWAQEDADFRGPFEVILPLSKDVLGIRMMSGSDENRARQLEENESGNLSSASLFIRVETINGERANKQTIRRYKGRDARALRDALEEFDCGVDLWAQLRCKHCRQVNNYDIPVDENFFSPGSNRRTSGNRR